MARATNLSEAALLARSWAILFGVSAFVALALGSGLDRLAIRQPALAGMVPTPMAAEAHRVRAIGALRKRDQAEALSAARQAVAADPVDPRSAALLGAARLLSRQPVLADPAFRVSAQLGWRDPLTQLYFMNQALRSGDMNMAALRLDAVLRQNPLFPGRDAVLSQFAASHEGRRALARRLVLRPPWSSQFMGKDSRLTLAELRARAATLQAAQGKQWGCDAIAPLVNRLVEAGDPITAKRLWSRHCPAASSTIADPAFAQLSVPREVTPFEWNLVGSGDITLAPAASKQPGLVARVSGAASRQVTWQMLTLPPGTYSLQWIAREPDGSSARALTLSLSCKLGEREPVDVGFARGGRFQAQFKVDGTCPSQSLAVWLAPTLRSVHLESISIERQR